GGLQRLHLMRLLLDTHTFLWWVQDVQRTLRSLYPAPSGAQRNTAQLELLPLPNQRESSSRRRFRKYRQKLRKIPCRTTSPGAAVTSASMAVKNCVSIVFAAPSIMRWPTP